MNFLSDFHAISSGLLAAKEPDIPETLMNVPTSELAGALLGGVLVGLSTALMLLFSGRIAGISGILGGLLPPSRGDALWRVAFVLGLLVGGFAFAQAMPTAFPTTNDASTPTLVVAGLLVGFGTRLGNGCTSGHGVCGVSRLSPRSLIATMTFIAAGAITVFIVQHVLGGAL